MSDLQDALKRRDTWWNDSNDHQRLKDRQMFVDAARKVANPDLTMLDGYPDLYEIAPKQLAALETLGVNVAKVPNAYIIGNVIAGIEGGS